MPTLPPQPHEQRQVAESFGADAARYHRARPDYPEAMVRRIVETSPGPDLLDVGTGTGIAATQFQAAGCRVLGVEVDPRMAELARRAGIPTEVAAFETWEPGDRRFDVVAAGQAWHWVDPVAGAAKAAQVLRPGGRLAAFWNVFQPPADLAEAFTAVYRRVLPPDSPAHRGITPGTAVYGQITDRAADGIRAAGAFDQPTEWQFEWQRRYTRDEWLDQVPTFGGHSQFPPDALAALLAGIGAAVDEVGGSFPMRYTTLVITAARG